MGGSDREAAGVAYHSGDCRGSGKQPEKAKLDVVLCLDGSSSVSAADWTLLVGFLVQVIIR